MARVITRDFEAETIREAMVTIIGETLDVDRTLIYDIRFADQVAEGLSEWLNPAAGGIDPTLATYPLSRFSGGAEHVYKTRAHMESHHDDIHVALQRDGSAANLHGAMSIKSLLWFPFDFEDERFFVLVFNQVRHKRRWSAEDISFVESMSELVSMAHLRMRLESQRAERHERSEQLRRLEGLGLLAGGVAHDFNNLLTVILGSSSLVSSQLPSDSLLRPVVTNITHAAESAAAICKQLLSYSGRLDPTLSRLNINETVEQTIVILTRSLDLPIQQQLASKEVWVDGDRTQIQQMLLNLLTNAADAMRDSGGEIVVRTGHMTAAEARTKGVVFLSAEPTGSIPFLAVEDAGTGIDPKTAARMFDPFFTTRKTGHGLGLATVHGAVKSHRASIGVESRVGSGSTFTVVFPNPDRQSQQPNDSIAPSESNAASVLIVDDEFMVCAVSESVLALDGYQVRTASSGKKALAVCKDAVPPVDLVVMDVGMPGLDGRETFGAMRAAGHTFPILMISAYPIDEAFNRAGYTGWAFLQKPFRPDELLSSVRRLLGRRLH